MTYHTRVCNRNTFADHPTTSIALCNYERPLKIGVGGQEKHYYWKVWYNKMTPKVVDYLAFCVSWCQTEFRAASRKGPNTVRSLLAAGQPDQRPSLLVSYELVLLAGREASDDVKTLSWFGIFGGVLQKGGGNHYTCSSYLAGARAWLYFYLVPDLLKNFSLAVCSFIKYFFYIIL